MLDQAFCWSTGRLIATEVGRPMYTDVHGMFGWRTGRPTRSTARELCSLDLALVNRAVDRQRASALCIQASVDWSVDRWHNSQKSDRWPVDQAVVRQQSFLLSWTPTAIFLRPINWGYFSQDFWRVFKLVFPTLLSVYLHLF